MSIEPARSKWAMQLALQAAAGDHPLLRPLLVAVHIDLERAQVLRDTVEALCTLATTQIRLGDLDGATSTIDKIAQTAK